MLNCSNRVLRIPAGSARLKQPETTRQSSERVILSATITKHRKLLLYWYLSDGTGIPSTHPEIWESPRYATSDGYADGQSLKSVFLRQKATNYSIGETTKASCRQLCRRSDKDMQKKPATGKNNNIKQQTCAWCFFTTFRLQPDSGTPRGKSCEHATK